MKNRILISILCLMVAVHFMAFAEINITEGYDANGIVPISDSAEELISSAVPIDLLPDGNLTEHRVILNTFLTSGEKVVPQRLESESTTTLDVETSDYGQLKTLLAENGADSATSITVSGPINASDFNAIWECATIGNLRILDLSHSQLKDNVVPDYALYHTIQFETGHWLGIRKIILPEEIVRIGKAAFAFMHLEEINIPSKLKELGSTAFGYDYWLDCDIMIPDGVEEIKYQTFIDCRSLSRSPILPNTLRLIGEHAFANTPFVNIELNDGLETIRQGAFQSCGITQIEFPNTIIDLGPMAFQLCPKLKHISFPDVIEEIPMGLFSMCNALEDVNIPNGVRHIADNAFMMCTNLKDISLPETLESIGKDVFCDCIVEKIVLPGNLKSLGDGSFVIEDLKTVYCASEIPPFCEIGQNGPFAEEWISEAILYVPFGTKARYQSQWQWNLFKEIIETDDFPSSDIDCVTIDNKEQDNNYYDLFGRKIETPSPGNIYISNGKKFIRH